MNNSILTDVKQELGLAENYTPFDRALVSNINAVLMVLNQLGVGSDNFRITLQTDPDTGATSSSETWSQFLGSSYTGNMGAIKSYVAMKTKLMFDPPASGTLMESYKNLISEFEFRLNVAAGV